MSKNRTEETRLEEFQTSDQIEWAKKSAEVEKEIATLLGKNVGKNVSLLDIYNYARRQRKILAVEVNHDPNPKFGAVRIAAQEAFCDEYSPTQFVSGKPNPAALLKIEAVLASQNLQARELSKKEAAKIKDIPADVILSEGKTLKVIEYTLPPRKEASFNPTDYDVNSNDSLLYTDLNVKMYKLHYLNENNEVESVDTYVQVYWGFMNESLYHKRLEDLNPLVEEIKNPDCEGEKALFKIGLLAHELCRLMLLMRGSAAVNGWIVRGIAHMKGFELGVLKVNDLPFDIYAEIQQDPNKFAQDFVASMIKDFGLVFNKEEKIYSKLNKELFFSKYHEDKNLVDKEVQEPPRMHKKINR